MSRDTLISFNFSWLKDTLKPLSGIYSCAIGWYLQFESRLAFAGLAGYTKYDFS